MNVHSVHFLFSLPLPAQMKACGRFCPCVHAQAWGLGIAILFKAEIHQFRYNGAWMPL